MGFFKIILFLNTLLWSHAGNAQELPTTSFEELLGFKSQALPLKKPLLLYFFQPDCSSCAKQKKDLSCLAQNIEVVSIGVFGSKRELAKEAQKHKLQGTLLFGGKQAEKLFSVQQTPTLLFYDSTGVLKKRTAHWIGCDDLKKINLQ